MPVSVFSELNHAELSAEFAFAQSTSVSQLKARRAQPAYIRRRGSAEQGRALETLGHAVEYLVDSRLRFGDPQDAASEREAIEILMRLNRSVFSECPEVVPFGRRVREWFVAHFVRS